MISYYGPLQGKVMRKVSETLIDLSNLLPPQDTGFISELQHYYKHRFTLHDTRPPSGTVVEANAVWLLEAFKIEDFETLKRGLREIFAAHPRRTYFPPGRRIEEIEESIEAIRSNLNGGSWINIGFIEPNQNPTTPALPLVELIDFQLYACFQNLAILVIEVTPSKEFHRRFQKLVALHSSEQHVFTWQRFISRVWPFKALFKHGSIWTGYSLTATQVKAAHFDELFCELKDSAAELVSSYLPGYFHNRESRHPSVELYLFEEAATKTNPPVTPPPTVPKLPKSPIPAFWESLRMDRRGFRTYSEPENRAYLFDPMSSYDIRTIKVQPIRILIDRTKIQLDSGYQDIQRQIASMVSDWVLSLAPLWTLLNILFTIEGELPDRRDSLFNQARHGYRWWPFPSTGFRLDLMADWFTFERLRGDFRLRDIKIMQMSHGLPKFSWGFKNSTSTEIFFDNLLAEVREHIHKTNKIFKMLNFASNEMLQVDVIRSNFWLQIVMLFVAIASLVVALTTLKVAL